MKRFQLNKAKVNKYEDKTLYRIMLTDNFKAIGGYIEDESCLSQAGNCWIDKDSIVTKGSRIADNCYIHNSKIIGNFSITGDVTISESTLKGHGAIVKNSYLYGCNINGLLSASGSVSLKSVNTTGDLLLNGDITIHDVTIENNVPLGINSNTDVATITADKTVKSGLELIERSSSYDTLVISSGFSSPDVFIDYSIYVKGITMNSAAPNNDLNLFIIAPNILFINSLHIAPDKRRKGYATKVLNDLYKQCPIGSAIVLEVSELSDAETIGIDNLYSFYESNGFQRLKNNICIKVKE